MTRLMPTLAAASGDNPTIGEWAANNGIGGVGVVLIAAAVLYGLFKLIGGKKN